MVQAKADIPPGSSAKPGLPERIGKYVIINEVGQGSSGRVYLTHDPYYGHDVAIKVYNSDTEEGYSRNEADLFLIDELKTAKQLFEKKFIRKKLQEHNHNITHTAKTIGVGRSYLHKKLKN